MNQVAEVKETTLVYPPHGPVLCVGEDTIEVAGMSVEVVIFKPLNDTPGTIQVPGKRLALLRPCASTQDCIRALAALKNQAVRRKSSAFHKFVADSFNDGNILSIAHILRDTYVGPEKYAQTLYTDISDYFEKARAWMRTECAYSLKKSTESVDQLIQDNLDARKSENQATSHRMMRATKFYPSS